MSAEMVAQVRRFNRTVTQRIGVLNENFLASDRSLGQNRLLWEIGPDGCDIRTLRTRLDLDSGYLSRLLRALETGGFVVVEPSATDRRIRIARLTEAGCRELATLLRGLGLGRRLLYELEVRARAHGVRLMRLETKDEPSEAIPMYETSGYIEVEPFNDEPYADHWFEKPLNV
jgi:DNA-binding MarR family transcriptional regulator